MLPFCEKCGNVMTLKEKKGRSNGDYECRTCGFVRDMRISKIELKETIFEEPVAKLIPDELKLSLF